MRNSISQIQIEQLSFFDKVIIFLPAIGRLIEDVFFQETLFFTKGVSFYFFIPFLVFTIIRLSSQLNRVIVTPITIIYSLFLIVCYVLEKFHNEPMYREISRIFFTLMTLVPYAAWVLKDVKSIYYIAVSFIVLSLVYCLNVSLNVSLFDMLAIGNAESARDYVDENTFFSTNLNGVGYWASTSAVICFIVLKYFNFSKSLKIFYQICGVIFIYTLIICVSRSAYLNFLIIVIILGVKSIIKLKPQYYIGILVILVTLYIGGANNFTSLISQRFESVSLNNVESMDSRTALYSKLLDDIDEVFLIGVGEGGYYGEWGRNSNLNKEKIDEYGTTYSVVPPTHNTFLAILFYWGILPLTIYLILQYQFFNFSLRNAFNPYLVLNLVFILSTVSLLFFTNNFNAKDFPLIYGILLGLKVKYENSNQENVIDFRQKDIAVN